MRTASPSALGGVRDPAARQCLREIYGGVDLRAIVWPYEWADRDDTNLFTSGAYIGQSISTPVNIHRVLLRAVHNCSSVTFELQHAAFNQDYTTYTETDPNNRFAVANNVITVTGLTNGEDAYAYKDFGGSYFTDFAHCVGPVQFTAQSGTLPCFAFYGLANAVDDCFALQQANDVGIRLIAYENGGSFAIQVMDTEDASSDTWTGPSAGTDYWFTIAKSGTALTVEISSTEALSLLRGAGDQDTLALTLASDGSYQYLYAVNSYRYSDGVMDASIANLALDPWKHVCFLTPGKETKGLNITSRNMRLKVTGASGDIMQYIKLNMSD